MTSPESNAPRPSHHARNLTLLVAGAAALAALAYKKARTATPPRDTSDPLGDATARAALGWGDVEVGASTTISTPDGAHLAVWEVGSGPTVVLPHCWGCSHAIWIPVARSLVESGHRVVLYDQRGHGESTRGTAPLDLVTLAHDLTHVLEAKEVRDAVIAGHSMGGMTIMALATYRPEVLHERARAIVLVATAAAESGGKSARADRLGVLVMGSSLTSRVLRSPQGYAIVRSAFGDDAVRAQVELTRTLFADCDPSVRAGFLASMNAMNLLEGIATIDLPTTVVVGSKDALTPPARSDAMAEAIRGAHLVTLAGRGHMLPLEDPDAVSDEILRAVKG